MKNKLIYLLIFCAMVAGSFGCKSSPNGRPAAWNISITKQTTASIQVDLIGVATQNEENFWNGVSAADYWKPGSQIRSDQIKLGNLLTKFLQEGKPWVIDQNNPQWQTWLNRGVDELFIIARLPEAVGDWKVQLPLGKKVWITKNKTIEIVVVDSGISIQTKSKN